MARRRFFVDSIERGHAQIRGDDAHHLTRVLRVEPGQKFEISDNRRVFLAEVESARKDLVVFLMLDEIDVPSPRLHSTLLASLIKFDRFEWMLEKATELGVDQIIPVQTERSEKGLEQAAEKRRGRWERIAREASEQSRRARLPVIESPLSLSDVLASNAKYRYVLEEGEAPPVLGRLPQDREPADTIALLAGPEGGWSDRERTSIRTAGWQPVSLGRNILRAETAAIVALGIIHAAWL